MHRNIQNRDKLSQEKVTAPSSNILLHIVTRYKLFINLMFPVESFLKMYTHINTSSSYISTIILGTSK